jgi:nitrile hydratase
MTGLGTAAQTEARFVPGDAVAVRMDTVRVPSGGHYRTPHYIRGKRGTVMQALSSYPNPELKAYGGDGLPRQPLYRVLFDQSDLWGARYTGPARDRLEIEIYDHWLERA